MKALILLILLIALPQKIFANDDKKATAREIVKMNESLFSYKELINNTAMCHYHNDLLKTLDRDQLPCQRGATPETKDLSVKVQLDTINKLSKIAEPTINDMIVNMPIRN